MKTTVLGRRGFPDRLAVFPGGRVWFVELKRPKGGVLAEHQIKWHNDLRALGATVMVFKNEREIDAAFFRVFGV